MKKTTIALSLVLAGGVLYGCTPAPETDNFKPRVVAPKNMEAKSALTTYSESAVPVGQPYVLFFHADWCPTCIAWEKSANEADLPANATILKLNYDESEELKAQYGVESQSTAVMIGVDGEVVTTASDPSMEAVAEFFEAYAVVEEEAEESGDESSEEAEDTEESMEGEEMDDEDAMEDGDTEVSVEVEEKVEAGL